jgi:hypothetical protein
MSKRRKIIVLSTLVLGVVVLIAVGWAAKDWLRESWLLHQLHATHEDDVEAAARQLGQYGSVDALAALIGALDCEGRHPKHEKGELRFSVGKALENLYLRYNPNPSFSLSYWDGPPQTIRLLQHINADPHVPHEARVAAVAILKKLELPLTPEEQEMGERLWSRNVDEQMAAIASLGRARTKRAARVLVDFLGNFVGRLQLETMRALKDMGEVAMEPLAESFQAADDFPGKPEQRQPCDFLSVDKVEVLLSVILEIQRNEVGVRSLLENPDSILNDPPHGKYRGWTCGGNTEPPFGKYLAWKSGVQIIEGRPCRIFLFIPESWGEWELQTILLTDVAGRVITWKEVGGCGEPFFLSYELETIIGALFLVITCEDARRETREKYSYRLTLRGIEEQR